MGFKTAKADFDREIAYAREMRKKLIKDPPGADAILFGYLDLLCCTLFEINGNLDSLAMSYSKMLKIHEAKTNGAKKTDQA
jgi:hypothetical protein